MQRLIASLVLCASLTAASAQISVKETDAMRNSALKHTDQVDHKVGLTAEQRDNVYAMYMKIEQYQDALDQRFTAANLTPEARETEMAPQRKNMAKMELEGLTKDLTPQQLEKWSAPAAK